MNDKKFYRKDGLNIYEYTISELCLKYNIEEKVLLKIVENYVDKSFFMLDQPDSFGGYVSFHRFYFDKKCLLKEVKSELERGIETMEFRLTDKKEYLMKISKELDEIV